jgi:Fic family protein
MDIFKKLEADFTIHQTILNLVSKIDQFKGKWDITVQKDNNYLKELKKIATVESIGSSTRIEGVQMTDEEIAGLLKNISITQLKTRDEQEVAGYYEALQVIMDNYADIPLTENQVKNLHNILLRFSSKDEHHRGNYKKLTNKVVANYPDGEQRVIFQTTEPHLTESEMHLLLSWTNEQFDKVTLHPLLNIATFVYEFLSIHPFQDGNGRLARLLTTLLLLKKGYLFVQYISFEQLIEERKKEYYEALMQGQKNRNTDDEIISHWILFFLNCLHTLTERLEMKYSRYQSKGGYLNERQKNILEFIKTKEPVKLNDINTAFDSVSVNTIKKDLLYLKTENYIEAVGVKKGTVYVIKK